MEHESQLTRLGLFDARVPRYTSYPTSPHFSGDIGADQFTTWIGALPEGAQVSVYLHVPFCRRLCWFCACRTQGTQSEDPLRAYSQTLLSEIAMLRAALPAGVTLSRLHWGGGTPTLLPPGLIRDLAGALFEAIPAAPGAEFSVEIDPNEIDAPRLEALAAAGMNRASIGVQDFDPEIQAMIGREQSYDLTCRAAEMIRASGITSLNADILYGLPGQNQDKISESVQKLLSLSPDRVALYGYAHVPWMAKRQVMIPADRLPDARARLALFETARQLFVWDGYAEIGIDHFARPEDGLAVAQRAGRLRRNFQGYTDDQAQALIGLGASSISRFPQGYAQNAPATGAHTAAIRDGHFSTTRGHVFSDEDHLRGRLIEALMCDFRVDLAEIRRRFSITPAALEAMIAPVLAQFGDMLRLTPEALEIPEQGRPLTRMIARAFDSYDLSRSGHSPAI